jgi:hypothetical protein
MSFDAMVLYPVVPVEYLPIDANPEHASDPIANSEVAAVLQVVLHIVICVAVFWLLLTIIPLENIPPASTQLVNLPTGEQTAVLP